MMLSAWETCIPRVRTTLADTFAIVRAGLQTQPLICSIIDSRRAKRQPGLLAQVLATGVFGAKSDK